MHNVDEQPQTPRHFVLWAIVFELALGLLACALGWWFDCLPWETISSGKDPVTRLAGLGGGAALALVLLAGVIATDRHPFWIFRDLQHTVRRCVLPLFREVGPWGLLGISLSAAVGEELLFRGFGLAVVRQWLLHCAVPLPWATVLALAGSSVVFGLCHWVSAAYALLAGLMGLLLGMLWLAAGDLLAPMVTHALYDFLALLYLTRAGRAAESAGLLRP